MKTLTKYPIIKAPNFEKRKEKARKKYFEKLDEIDKIISSSNPHGKANSELFGMVMELARLCRQRGCEEKQVYLDLQAINGRNGVEWNYRIASRWAKNALELTR